jgi:hypothetical protein
LAVISGEERLVLAVTEVRGPAHAVIAVLSQSKLDGEPFARAWYKAIRALAPPRSAPADLVEAIAEDRMALAEIRPFLKAAYENRPYPPRTELTRARRLAERRLADLAA